MNKYTNWYKGENELTDREIIIELQRLSEKAIQEMELCNKDTSIKYSNELEGKVKALIEDVCSWKGFYVGTTTYDFYELFISEMRELVAMTNDRMIEIFEEKESKGLME